MLINTWKGTLFVSPSIFQADIHVIPRHIQPQSPTETCDKTIEWKYASLWRLNKCTLVQALMLCTGHTAQMVGWGIALLFLDHGTRRGWGFSSTPRPLFTPGKDPVPIVQEAGWARGPVWTGAEKVAPTGIRSPDRPARSQSLYRLS